MPKGADLVHVEEIIVEDNKESSGNVDHRDVVESVAHVQNKQEDLAAISEEADHDNVMTHVHMAWQDNALRQHDRRVGKVLLQIRDHSAPVVNCLWNCGYFCWDTILA